LYISPPIKKDGSRAVGFQVILPGGRELAEEKVHVAERIERIGLPWPQVAVAGEGFDGRLEVARIGLCVAGVIEESDVGGVALECLLVPLDGGW